MPNFDLSKYVDVAERIDQFYATYPSPNGRIETELLNVRAGPQTQFIVRALVYLDEICLATGLAEESLGGSGANKMAALENAETSAIGRALANMGFQTTRDGKRQRPSRQEMAKVTGDDGAAVDTSPRDAAMQYVIELLSGSGINRGTQQDIVQTAVGHEVRDLANLSDGDLALVTVAVESAIADRIQLEENV